MIFVFPVFPRSGTQTDLLDPDFRAGQVHVLSVFPLSGK